VPVLVTVDPASTAKLPALPSEIGIAVPDTDGTRIRKGRIVREKRNTVIAASNIAVSMRHAN
jgi:hypothetical protein